MKTAIACMDDLIFLSKIVEAAKALSVPLRSIKTAEKLVAACREGGDSVVFLDLDDPRVDAIALASALRSAAPEIKPAIYAFVSHVNEDRIAAASNNLFNRVFTRGQFVRILPELLGPNQPIAP